MMQKVTPNNDIYATHGFYVQWNLWKYDIYDNNIFAQLKEYTGVI